MQNMEVSRKDLRLLMLHEFRLDRHATEATRNICATMGQGAVSYNTVVSWFQKFRGGSFELEDEPRAGRPQQVDLELLSSLVQEDPRLSTRCLAERLGCSHTAVENHLHKLGKTWKYGIFVPHNLSSEQLKHHVDVCMQLLTYRRTFEWLRNIVAGDEKWVLYVNYSRKRQWLGSGESGEPTPKGELHPRKIMLCVWWNVKGIVHWELLPTGSTINANVYCAQLDRVAEKLGDEQDRVYFLHDNARPHIAKLTQKKLLELKWTVLPQPPYSPDIAPTDFHLFRSLQDHLQGRKFDDDEQLTADLSDFFNEKSKDFYERGILSLPNRWTQIIENDGQYCFEI